MHSEYLAFGIKPIEVDIPLNKFKQPTNLEMITDMVIRNLHDACVGIK